MCLPRNNSFSQKNWFTNVKYISSSSDSEENDDSSDSDAERKTRILAELRRMKELEKKAVVLKPVEDNEDSDQVSML